MCTDFRGRGGSRRPGRRRASPAEERAEAAAGGAEAAGGPSAGAEGESPSPRLLGVGGVGGVRAGGRSGGAPFGVKRAPATGAGALGRPAPLGCEPPAFPRRPVGRGGAHCACLRGPRGAPPGERAPGQASPGSARESWGRRGHGQAWERRAKCCVGLKHGGSERARPQTFGLCFSTFV